MWDGNYFIGHIPNITGIEKLRFKKSDTNGQVVDSIPANVYADKEAARKFHFYFPEAGFYLFDQVANVNELFNDTIFRFNSNFSLTPRYCLNLGEFALVANERYQLTNPQANLFEGKKYITSILESQRYLFLAGHGFDKDASFIYDKETQALTYGFIAYAETEKALFDKSIFLPAYIDAQRNILISIGQSANMEDESNPTLVLLTLHK